MCLRKLITEPKLLILVSFFLGEVTSYTHTSYCVHILREVYHSVFMGHPLYPHLAHVWTFSEICWNIYTCKGEVLKVQSLLLRQTVEWVWNSDCRYGGTFFLEYNFLFDLFQKHRFDLPRGDAGASYVSQLSIRLPTQSICSVDVSACFIWLQHCISHLLQLYLSWIGWLSENWKWMGPKWLLVNYSNPLGLL